MRIAVLVFEDFDLRDAREQSKALREPRRGSGNVREVLKASERPYDTIGSILMSPQGLERRPGAIEGPHGAQESLLKRTRGVGRSQETETPSRFSTR